MRGNATSGPNELSLTFGPYFIRGVQQSDRNVIYFFSDEFNPLAQEGIKSVK